jgi:hypothetical protein
MRSTSKDDRTDIQSKVKEVVKKEEEESDKESVHEVKKRNADTDARNPMFERSLAKRRMSEVPNLKLRNIEHVHSLNTGRELQRRIEIPEGIDPANFQTYGGCSKNNYDFQR